MSNIAMKLQRLGLGLLLAAALIQPASAFVNERPRNFTPVPEQSQEQLAAQQGYNGVAPEVGTVKIVEDSLAAPKVNEEQKAAQAVSASAPESKEAAQVLTKLEHAKQDGKTAPARSMIWGVLFLLFGFGVVMAFRFYADKTVPQMQATRGVRW